MYSRLPMHSGIRRWVSRSDFLVDLWIRSKEAIRGTALVTSQQGLCPVLPRKAAVVQTGRLLSRTMLLADLWSVLTVEAVRRPTPTWAVPVALLHCLVAQP